MKTTFDLRLAGRILAASISLLGGAALTPMAAAQEGPSEEVRRLIEPSSQVTIGVGGMSSKTVPPVTQGNWSANTNYMFGDYNGMYKKNGYLIGDVEISKRGEGNANYIELNGTNLGLDSRNLKLRGGEQGNWGLTLEYDQIHKLWSDSYQTPYNGAGSTYLTLPAGWVSNCAAAATPGTAVACVGGGAVSSSTGLMTNLPSSMKSFNIETERKSLAMGLSKILPGDWNVAANFKHETKQGSRLIGAVFGSSGGNPRAAVLPEPVDYVTRSLELIARYNTDNFQAQLAYFGSLFDNKNNGLVWQNAFGGATTGAATIWNNAAVGVGSLGQLGLPPDNQAHQLNGSFGYAVSKDTRLAGTLSVGRMTQNESFLPYTINAGLTSADPLPRSSLNGKVNTTHLDFKLTSKLAPKLNLVAAYRYDDRANKTPQSLYNYIGGDSQIQQNAVGTTNANSDRLRYNLPGSSKKQQVDVEMDYKLAAHTKLKFGAEYDWVSKTFEAITKEKEGTVKGELHQHFDESTSGGLSLSRSNRTTDTYDSSAPFKAAFTPLYVTGMGAANLQWDNNPYQRKFFLAPRVRNKLHGFMNLAPVTNLDLHLGLDYKDDNYRDSYYGLKRTKSYAQHFDANYAATEALTLKAFVSNDRSLNGQKSNTLGTVAGFCTGKSTPTAPGCEWTADILDHGVTTGFGFAYKPGAKYEVGFDYTRVYWTGEYAVSAGPALTQPTALPPDVSNMQRIDLFGRYQIEKDLSLNFKYIYERYRSRDWAVDGVVSNTLASVIGTNQTSPNYNVHALGVSLSYSFK